MGISLTLHEVLLLSVFIFQTLFISVFVSRSWRSNRRVLLENYPQLKFPNLYAQPSEVEFWRLKVRKSLDYVAMFIGLFILVVSLLNSVSLEKLSKNLLLASLLQIVPMSISAIWCNINANIMSKKFPKKIRKASFSENNFTDSVPLFVIVLIVISFIASVVLVTFANGAFEEKELIKSFQLVILNVIIMIIMILLGLRILYGVKKDNFAPSSELKERQLSKLKYFSYGLLSFNFFTLFLIVSNFIDRSPLFVFIITSLFVQVIVFTTRNQYLPIQPSVYKMQEDDLTKRG